MSAGTIVKPGRTSEPGRVSALRGNPAARAATWVLWAVGLIYLLATIVDFTILWGFQRQDNVQWEFVALTRTAEGWPRLLLAMAFIYVALALKEEPSKLLVKGFGVFLIVLGLAGAAIGAMAGMDFLSLRAVITENPGREALQTSTLKTLALSAMYFLFVVPAGVVALLGPRKGG